MNLVWHIIKKDLLRFRWELAILAVAFVYGRRVLADDFNIGGWEDFFGVIAIVTWGVLSVAMIVGVVQEDSPVETKAHWRTRAIAPKKLLLAKLIFITVLFVGLPLLASWHFMRVHPFHPSKGPGLIYGSSLIVTIPLTFAAVASCTKTSRDAFSLWFGILFATGLMHQWLPLLLPLPNRLSRIETASLYLSKAVVILGFCAVISLMVLVIQYLKRRRSVALIVIGIGVLGSVFVGTYWRLILLR